MLETKGSVNITTEFVSDGYRYFVGTITQCLGCLDVPKYISVEKQIGSRGASAEIIFVDECPNDTPSDKLVELQIVAKRLDYPSPVLPIDGRFFGDGDILLVEALETVAPGMKFCLEGKSGEYVCQSCTRRTIHGGDPDDELVFLVVATEVGTA